MGSDQLLNIRYCIICDQKFGPDTDREGRHIHYLCKHPLEWIHLAENPGNAVSDAIQDAKNSRQFDDRIPQLLKNRSHDSSDGESRRSRFSDRRRKDERTYGGSKDRGSRRKESSSSINSMESFRHTPPHSHLERKRSAPESYYRENDSDSSRKRRKSSSLTITDRSSRDESNSRTREDKSGVKNLEANDEPTTGKKRFDLASAENLLKIVAENIVKKGKVDLNNETSDESEANTSTADTSNDDASSTPLLPIESTQNLADNQKMSENDNLSSPKTRNIPESPTQPINPKNSENVTVEIVGDGSGGSQLLAMCSEETESLPNSPFTDFDRNEPMNHSESKKPSCIETRTATPSVFPVSPTSLQSPIVHSASATPSVEAQEAQTISPSKTLRSETIESKDSPSPIRKLLQCLGTPSDHATHNISSKSITKDLSRGFPELPSISKTDDNNELTPLSENDDVAEHEVSTASISSRQNAELGLNECFNIEKNREETADEGLDSSMAEETRPESGLEEVDSWVASEPSENSFLEEAADESQLGLKHKKSSRDAGKSIRLRPLQKEFHRQSSDKRIVVSTQNNTVALSTCSSEEQGKKRYHPDSDHHVIPEADTETQKHQKTLKKHADYNQSERTSSVAGKILPAVYRKWNGGGKPDLNGQPLFSGGAPKYIGYSRPDFEFFNAHPPIQAILLVHSMAKKINYEHIFEGKMKDLYLIQVLKIHAFLQELKTADRGYAYDVLVRANHNSEATPFDTEFQKTPPHLRLPLRFRRFWHFLIEDSARKSQPISQMPNRQALENLLLLETQRELQSIKTWVAMHAETRDLKFLINLDPRKTNFSDLPRLQPLAARRTRASLLDPPTQIGNQASPGGAGSNLTRIGQQSNRTFSQHPNNFAAFPHASVHQGFEVDPMLSSQFGQLNYGTDIVPNGASNQPIDYLPAAYGSATGGFMPPTNPFVLQSEIQIQNNFPGGLRPNEPERYFDLRNKLPERPPVKERVGFGEPPNVQSQREIVSSLDLRGRLETNRYSVYNNNE